MASHHHHHHGHDHNHDHDHAPGVPSVPLDPAAESLSQALRSGFNVLRIVMIVLLVAYFFSGWFQVNPNEQGLIVRLGSLRENKSPAESASRFVFGPGSHASLPDPFDTKIRLPSSPASIEVASFCFARSPEMLKTQQPLAQMVPQLERLPPATHGTMLSGDRNLSHGVFTIDYQILDGEKFVRNVGENLAALRPVLTRLAESAIVRTTSGIEVDRVLRRGEGEKAADFTVEVARRLNKELELLETGVSVMKVTADTIEPGFVRQAFIAVSNAKNNAEQSKNEARAERARVLSAVAGPREKHEKLLELIDQYGALQTPGPDGKTGDTTALQAARDAVDQQLDSAEGEVARILGEARSRANEVRERVQREFEEFTYYRAAYRKSPRLTTVRLWVRMRDAILGSKDNEVFFVPRDANVIEIITNRDPQKLIDADRERWRSRGGATGP